MPASQRAEHRPSTTSATRSRWSSTPTAARCTSSWSTPNDPIIQVYERAFPDLFTPVSQADKHHPRASPPTSATRRTSSGCRPPCTGATTSPTPADFYSQAQAWSVSPDPGSGQLSSSSPLLQPTVGANGQLVTPQVARLAPQYILAHLPGSTQQSFMLLDSLRAGRHRRPQRQNLTAFMTASSDPSRLRHAHGLRDAARRRPSTGPALITNAIRSNTAISSELTLLNQQGSKVELGEVAVVPIDQTLLYVQTVYVESSANQIPTLKDVVVVYNGKAYQSGNASLDNALCQITNPDGTQPFSSYCNTAAARAPRCQQPGTSTGTGTGPVPPARRPTTTVPPHPRRPRPRRPRRRHVGGVAAGPGPDVVQRRRRGPARRQPGRLPDRRAAGRGLRQRGPGPAAKPPSTSSTPPPAATSVDGYGADGAAPRHGAGGHCAGPAYLGRGRLGRGSGRMPAAGGPDRRWPVGCGRAAPTPVRRRRRRGPSGSRR